MQAAVAAAASNVVDSFITEDEVVEGVAHGLVEVPYHLAVVVTKLSKAQRMMWDCVGQDHHQNVSSRIKRSLGSARGAIPGPPTRAPGGNDDICTRLKGCRPVAVPRCSESHRCQLPVGRRKSEEKCSSKMRCAEIGANPDRTCKMVRSLAQRPPSFSDGVFPPPL